ncbi:MAG: hypothetical protein ACRDO1_01610 [Nocardioidaceae bacterium]
MHRWLGGLFALGLAAVLVWLFTVAPLVMAGVVVAAIAMLIILPDLPW